MYRLTDVMLQNLEKDLIKFHNLFQGGRCQAWQLEELIAKAIRSDFVCNDNVKWKGNGHDVGCDIIVNDKHDIQIKSGSVKKDNLMLSGHRLGRFKGDFNQINQFLNQNTYLIVSVPYEKKEGSFGIKHEYQLFYIPSELLHININQNWLENDKKTGHHCTNKHNVYLTISPSMSWQIWWRIPLSCIDDKDKTRVISIV